MGKYAKLWASLASSAAAILGTWAADPSAVQQNWQSYLAMMAISAIGVYAAPITVNGQNPLK